MPDEYYEAVCTWFKRRHGWAIEKEWMIYTSGVVPAVSAIIKALTVPGDKVLVQTPVYNCFFSSIRNNGCEVTNNPLVYENHTYRIDFEDLERKASDERVKVMLLCNPHNPLGRVWTKEELERMLTICFENDVLVVSDEIHSDLIFHGKKPTRTATISKEIHDYVVTCVSVTKTFNLAGLQASTTIFPNLRMKADFDRYWSSMDIHRNNAFSSVAIEAAYREGREWLDQLLPYLSANFDFVKEYCEKNIPQIKPNIPDATYLVWLDCRDLGMSNEELRKFMIEKAKIGLNEGYTFGIILNYLLFRSFRLKLSSFLL